MVRAVAEEEVTYAAVNKPPKTQTVHSTGTQQICSPVEKVTFMWNN